MSDGGGDDIFGLLHSHYKDALTAAGFSVLGVILYSWFKKIAYNQLLQAIAICVFVAVVADVTLLEWAKLPRVACVLIGAVSGFIGRPLVLKYVSGKDEAIADDLLKRAGKLAGKDTE